MKRLISYLACLLVLHTSVLSQETVRPYLIKTDTVRIYSGSTKKATLVIENDTKDTSGFLFNQGGGVTKFLRGARQTVNNSYLIGLDTVTVGIDSIAVNSDSSLYNYRNSKFIGFKSFPTLLQKVKNDYPVTFNFVGDTLHVGVANTPENGLFIGGNVSYSGTGLTYNVTAAGYNINHIQYASASGSITLDAADPTFDRVDYITLNTSGQIVKITGVASANPADPQADYNTQLDPPLTRILVKAGSTVPSDVSIELIYDENTETWSHTNTSGVTIDFSSSTDAFHLTKSANVGTYTVAKNINFIHTGNLDRSNFNIWKAYVKLKAALPLTSNLQVQFVLGTTAVSPNITLGAAQGFDKNGIGFQNITLNLATVAFTNTIFDRIVFKMTGTGSGLFLDYVQLQGGVTGGTVGNFVTHVFKKTATDSIFEVINGINAFTFRDSAGGVTLADNGLTKVSSTIGLGGTLNKIDTIHAGAYRVYIETSTSANNPFKVSSTTDLAIYGSATSGAGIYGESTSTGATGVGVYGSTAGGVAIYGTSTSTNNVPIVSLSRSVASTNTITSAIELYRSSTGTPGNNIGQSINFYTGTSGVGAQSNTISNSIASRFIVADFPTRLSEMFINGISSGTVDTIIKMQGDGKIYFPKYSGNNFPGTPDYALGMSGGQVVTFPVPGSGGASDLEATLTAGNTAENKIELTHDYGSGVVSKMELISDDPEGFNDPFINLYDANDGSGKWTSYGTLGIKVNNAGNGSPYTGTTSIMFPTMSANQYMALSVNGNYADNSGAVTLSSTDFYTADGTLTGGAFSNFRIVSMGGKSISWQNGAAGQIQFSNNGDFDASLPGSYRWFGTEIDAGKRRAYMGDVDTLADSTLIKLNDVTHRITIHGRDSVNIITNHFTVNGSPITGGTNYFTKTGNYIYPNNTTDSIAIGGTTPLHNFQIGSGNTGLYFSSTGYLNIGSSVISRAAMSLNRNLTGVFNSGHHGYEDHDSVNTTGSPNAHFSYDDQHVLYGSGSYDHNGSIQIRPEMAGSTAITTRFEGINITMVHNSSGVLAAVRGISIQDLAGTGVGSVTYQAGLEIASQTKGVTKFAIKTNLGAVSFGDTVRCGKDMNIFAKLMVGSSTLPTLANAITVKTVTTANTIVPAWRSYQIGGGTGAGTSMQLGYGDSDGQTVSLAGFSDGTGRAFSISTNLSTTASTEVFRITPGGKVGILTTIPDSTLTVNGGLRVTGLLNSTGGTDSMVIIKTNGAFGKMVKPVGTDSSGAAIYAGTFATAEAAITGSCTWGGGTPPTGETAKFSWTQNVLTRQVTVNFYVSYSVIGSSNTSVIIPWQASMPTPVKHAGLTSASQTLYAGIGYIQGSEATQNTSAQHGYLRENAANTSPEFLVNSAAVSGKFVTLQVTYDY